MKVRMEENWKTKMERVRVDCGREDKREKLV